MENFKSILFLIIILVIIVLGGYWAVSTIEPGSINVEREKQKELEQKNQELEKEIQELKDKIAILEHPTKEQIPVEENIEKPNTNTPENNATLLKYQSLIDDLQKLIDDNIHMKEKSYGTRVGTIQTFLNIYNNTTKKVDNDYGAGTKTDVIKFQKAEKITADGEAGPSTFLKMIDWLKKR